MSVCLQRPAAVSSPGAGLLRADHFQVAYVTNDIERARDIFQRRYGIDQYRSIGGEMPAGGHIHAELAWVGNTMYELVSASGPGSEHFNRFLPQDDFGLVHHHLGFLIDDQAGWDALMLQVEQGGFERVAGNHNPGFMRHCFIDAPELGHLLEYIWPEPAGLEFFNSVPANQE